MSKHDHEAHSQPETVSAAPPDEQSHDRPTNENASTVIETWPDGDPHVFARALARVLVRQVLREQRAIASNVTEPVALAG